MKSDILQAMQQVCDEKGISFESVTETIELALAAAFRKDFSEKNQNISAEFDPETGVSSIYDIKTVVQDFTEEELVAQQQAAIEEREREIAAHEARMAHEGPVEKNDGANAHGDGSADGTQETTQEVEEEPAKRFNPKLEIMLTPAREIKPDAQIGDELKIHLEVPQEYGRMAAQTAKQVIMQRLREAERENVFAEYKGKEGKLVTGVVQRQEGRVVLVDLGHTTGLLLASEQIESEMYMPGQRVKVLILSVNMTTRGPEVLVSRSHADMVRVLFTNEVPEIASGVVVIKAVAREAGARSKIAVESTDDNIDPIGSCVGQRGTRVQTVINELGGEKIDIIPWSEEPAEFIANAMAPAKVLRVDLVHPETHMAEVWVRDEQLSLAIGKFGQNVRLAAKLSGWKLDVKADGGEFMSNENEIDETEDGGPIELAPEPNEAAREASQETPLTE